MDELEQLLGSIHLTATERRIINILKDGQLHTKEEMMIDGMQDPYAEMGALSAHVCNIRGKIRDLGLDLISQCLGHHRKYRMIRPLHGARVQS